MGEGMCVCEGGGGSGTRAEGGCKKDAFGTCDLNKVMV